MATEQLLFGSVAISTLFTETQNNNQFIRLNGNTTNELLFSMCVEFIGLTFFSFLTGTISVMFSGDQSFESLINARMEQLDLWLLRLENCNKEEKIPNRLYHSIKEFIQDAFVYDYNLIIEEFNFYNELPAQI